MVANIDNDTRPLLCSSKPLKYVGIYRNSIKLLKRHKVGSINTAHLVCSHAFMQECIHQFMDCMHVKRTADNSYKESNSVAFRHAARQCAASLCLCVVFMNACVCLFVDTLLFGCLTVCSSV